MEKKIVVAQCGRDKNFNIIEEGKHLNEAVWLENQPEGTGWFVPPMCSECQAKFSERLKDRKYQVEIDAGMHGPQFREVTDEIEAYAAYRRIMREE